MISGGLSRVRAKRLNFFPFLCPPFGESFGSISHCHMDCDLLREAYVQSRFADTFLLTCEIVTSDHVQRNPQRVAQRGFHPLVHGVDTFVFQLGPSLVVSRGVGRLVVRKNRSTPWDVTLPRVWAPRPFTAASKVGYSKTSK